MKVNIAFLVCSVFICRILFMNIGIVSSTLQSSQYKGFIKSQFSSTMKRREHLEITSSTAYISGYSAVEICEENGNGNNEPRSNSFILKRSLSSLFSCEVGKPFYKYLSYISSSRHLMLQVIRV